MKVKKSKDEIFVYGVYGFDSGKSNRRTNIADLRGAFATEKYDYFQFCWWQDLPYRTGQCKQIAQNMVKGRPLNFTHKPIVGNQNILLIWYDLQCAYFKFKLFSDANQRYS